MIYKKITRKDILSLLRTALNNPDAQFREGQFEAIEAIFKNKEKLLVVQSTGWGKSIVYFLATKILRDSGAGPTLIVSPLLSLMRNQLTAAKALRMTAKTINSSNKEEWTEVEYGVKSGLVDLLMISPERLGNENFKKNILAAISGKIGLFAVDEAHCISDWGHDFRPDYRRIVRIIQAMPSNIPVLATTATANDRVVEDIISQLGKNLIVQRGILARKSLKLQNINLLGMSERMAWLAEHLMEIDGSGIIYTLTVKDAENVAGWLRSRMINARAYHSDSENREELEQGLIENRFKALVATTALGMGFDKPDLSFVIHFQRPGSVVHYYQQIGRAGRAIESAYCILLNGKEDQDITNYFIENAFPPQEQINEVLQLLNSADDGLSINEIKRSLNYSHSRIEKILKFLEMEKESPVSKIKNKYYANPVNYLPDLERINRIISIKKIEQVRMSQYMDTKNCLMEFLQKELSDTSAAPCGKCSNCLKRPLIGEEFSLNLAAEAEEFLRRRPVLIEPRKQWPVDGLKSMGWKGSIKKELSFEIGWALCSWGDCGWGTLVRQGKQVDCYFSDELVNAMAEMIQSRWKPNPFPVWMTYVPSLNHVNLVSDFTKRLAEKLSIEFVHCIDKTEKTAPQKFMLNSFQQVNNLDGTFRIYAEKVMNKPVFLVDDIVDSKWTMTIVSALLRDSGSGPVYPLALSSAAVK